MPAKVGAKTRANFAVQAAGGLPSLVDGIAQRSWGADGGLTKTEFSDGIHGAVAHPQRSIVNKRAIRYLLLLGLILSDVAAIRAGFSVGVSLRGVRWLAPNGVELGWVMLPLHILLTLRNGAVSTAALRRRSESVRRAVGAFVVAIGATALLMFFQAAGPLVSRLAFGISIVCAIAFLVIFRLIFSICFIAPIRGGLMSELLIVDGVAPRPGAFHVFDAQAAGLIPDLSDPAMLSSLALLVEPYDRVVVTSVEERRHEWAMLLKAYNVTGEIVVDQGNPFGAIDLSRYHGSDTVVVSGGQLSIVSRIKKRAMDIVVASIALLLAAPILLLIAVAIKLDSPGPALFAQTRLGRGNKQFRILKFRSMKVHATDHAGARSASRDDDRITRVGRLIRATSLDELPQLFNVLRGDMSIVGPRPHALGSLAGDKLFWEVSQKYWLRHKLKPGITGLAQIRGFRGATQVQSDLEQRLQADLEYIDRWTLWRDVIIIFNTLRVIVHPKAF